jgi:hypothetical protein
MGKYYIYEITFICCICKEEQFATVDNQDDCAICPACEHACYKDHGTRLKCVRVLRGTEENWFRGDEMMD